MRPAKSDRHTCGRCLGERPARGVDPLDLLIAKTNAQVRALNDEVRVGLRRDGRIVGEDIEVAAVTPSGHGQTLAFATGVGSLLSANGGRAELAVGVATKTFRPKRPNSIGAIVTSH